MKFDRSNWYFRFSRRFASRRFDLVTQSFNGSRYSWQIRVFATQFYSTRGEISSQRFTGENYKFPMRMDVCIATYRDRVKCVTYYVYSMLYSNRVAIGNSVISLKIQSTWIYRIAKAQPVNVTQSIIYTIIFI